jgi:hypothetical protein
LYEQGDNHLTRELIVSQAITRNGHICIHLRVEEYQEQANQKLDSRYNCVKILARLLLLDAREQSLKVGVLVK